jgi:kynureninase
MSNAQIFPMAIHKASIELFDEAGIENLRKKSLLLTGFLEYLIEEANKENDLGFKIITPKNETERGCQLSLMTGTNGKQLFEKLTTNDVIADWREPNEAFGMGGVIRVAPTPMYNTFEEVYRFVQILKS